MNSFLETCSSTHVDGDLSSMADRHWQEARQGWCGRDWEKVQRNSSVPAFWQLHTLVGIVLLHILGRKLHSYTQALTRTVVEHKVPMTLKRRFARSTNQRAEKSPRKPPSSSAERPRERERESERKRERERERKTKKRA